MDFRLKRHVGALALGMILVSPSAVFAAGDASDKPQVMAEIKDKKACVDPSDPACMPAAGHAVAGDVKSDTPEAKDSTKAPGVGLGTVGRHKSEVPVDTGTTGTSGMQMNSPSANGGIAGSASRGR